MAEPLKGLSGGTVNVRLMRDVRKLLDDVQNGRVVGMVALGFGSGGELPIVRHLDGGLMALTAIGAMETVKTQIVAELLSAPTASSEPIPETGRSN